MKAIGFTQTGGPEVLELIDLSDLIPESDEVVIRIEAIGLNFADIYRRRGEYDSEPPSPYVLGHEGSGVIYSVGPNVKELSIGDRVAFAHVPRANAEFVKAPVWKVIPLPDYISFEVAASILLQGLTAHYLTHDSFMVKPRDTVVIHSASGGVGLLLVQICKNIGAKIVGTVSSQEKVRAAKDAGADFVIVRSQGDWKKTVLEISKGVGVDVVYDAIGATLEESLSVVKSSGTVVYFGWAGGLPPKIDPNVLMSESKSLVGGELWSHIADRNSLLNRSSILFSWLKEKKIRPQIFGRFPLSETSEAHRAIENGRTIGKILLIPDKQENHARI